MKNLVTITVILILVTLSQGCRHKTERLEPYSWTLIDSKFDSLTRVAEAYMYTPITADSMASVVTQMDSIARASGTSDIAKELKARTNYWKAFSMYMDYHLIEARELLCKLDSTTDDRYTKERIKSFRMTLGEALSFDTFKSWLEQLKYFESIGDLPQAGNTAMLLNSSLLFTDVPDLALYYLYMADSLFKKSGTEARAVNLRANEAVLLCKAGRMEEAEKAFERILTDPVLIANKDLHELHLRNHYYFFGDSISLFEGYAVQKEKEKDNIESKTLTFLYEALIGEYYLNKGEIKSSSNYLENQTIDIEDLVGDNYKSKIYEVYGMYYDSIGERDKAIAAMNRFNEMTEEIDENQQPENKIYTDFINAKEQFEKEAEETENSIRTQLYVTVAVSLLVLLLILIFGRKWYQRHRIKHQETLRRAEQRERELMGSALLRQHSEQILDYVDNEITRLGSQNVITGRDIAQLDRNLHLQKLDRKGIQSFEETFTSIHPYFETNLRNIAPDLSDTQVRLCAYIMLGMNNQEIASMLNIKPSSLRQARMRLRQKFGLTKDDSISEFLKQFTPPMLAA